MTDRQPYPDPSTIRHSDDLERFIDACEAEKIDAQDGHFRLGLTGPDGGHYELTGGIGRTRSKHGTEICLYDQDADLTLYRE